jgi:hypothetical protein
MKKLPSALIVFMVVIALVAGALILHQQGFFYGKKLLDATFLDERSRMDLALYSDGHYIIDSGWMFGSDRYSGTYRQDKESITFDEYPVVDNDFVAKTISKRGNKIYFFRDEQGQLKDTSFYYFRINSSE